MNFSSLFLVALALSLDAFGVAVCIGLNKGVLLRQKIKFCISSAFFQFLFSLLGALAGFFFNTYIASVPKVIGGVIIAVVGVLMIKEGFENKGECPILNPKMYLVLGVSVSIDALVVGFTVFNQISGNFILLQNTIFVGVVTFIMTFIAFAIAKTLTRIALISKYADYLGGIILILFGIKMIFF